MELEFHQLDLRYEALRHRHSDRERRLVASLAEIGQQMPIIVLSSSAAPHVVLDGYKRVRALRRLKKDTVRATAWTLDESEALVLESILRKGEGGSALEQGWLLKELRDRFALSLDELGRRFDRTRSWVSRRLALVDALPSVIRDKVQRGQIGAHAAMKYLVPLARANEDDCIRLVNAVAPLRLTTRELEALYTAYVASPAHGKELLLQDPRLFLRAHDVDCPSGQVERAPGEQLLSDVALLGAVARRILRQMKSGVAVKLRPGEREEIASCARQTQLDLERLLKRMKEVLDARSEHASGDPASA